MTKELQVKELRKYFPIKGGIFGKIRGYVKAVDGVSFSIESGETFGLVGESGSGKTTVGRTVVRLIPPDSGEISFDGIDASKLKGKDLKSIRRRMQIVFQDPYASLDPRQTIKGALTEPMKAHNLVKSEAEATARAKKLISKVGLNEDHLYRFPHEFSGGQRQRIAVARALTTDPDLIVLDEPTSFLDVSVQAQILTLLSDLQEELGLMYLFISHNLAVIEYMSNRIGVMYLGVLVEVADKQHIYSHPAHPYTQALISAIPNPNLDIKKNRIILPGDVPSPVNIPTGCRFHPRCPYAKQNCRKEEPTLERISSNQYAACFYPLV
jgi:oligopeptide/dipeptide ABC transporter ATP-binding protein